MSKRGLLFETRVTYSRILLSQDLKSFLWGLLLVLSSRYNLGLLLLNFAISRRSTVRISPAILAPSSSSKSSRCPLPNIVQLLLLISGIVAGRGIMWKCTCGTTCAALAPLFCTML